MSNESTPVARRVSPVHRFAGAALGALDRVGDAPGWAMSPEEQAETLVELTRLEARLGELRLRVLAAADRNRIGEATGATSTAAWLARQTKVTRVRANADLRLALALDDERFAATREALAKGELLVEQARVVVAAVEDLPTEGVTDAERERAQRDLVALATKHDAKGLRIVGRRLFELIAPDEADRREGEALERDEQRARERCGFAMRDNGDGTARGWFTLPTLQAQMLNKAVQAFAAPRRTAPDAWLGADGKRLPYRVLLGQGFAELVEHLPVDRLPRAGGVAACVNVTLDLDKLRGALGAAGLDTGERISAAQARRLACTAGIVPVVLGSRSEPLDVGRQSRCYTVPQRRALDVRDGGCTTEGCDRPAAWCEAHHDEPWSQGGRTDLRNGRLLCPRHHHLAHDSRYRTRKHPGGKVSFHRKT